MAPRKRPERRPRRRAPAPPRPVAGPIWHRTTVYLATDEYEALRLKAFQDRVTMAELVRQAVRSHLEASCRAGQSGGLRPATDSGHDD